jgi:hypothetical protein
MKPETTQYLASRLNEARRGTKRPKVVGYSKKHHTCDHCGKTGLDRTVEIELPDGSIAHFGSECADRAKSLQYKPSKVADKSDPIEEDDEGEESEESEDEVEDDDDEEEDVEEDEESEEEEFEPFFKSANRSEVYIDPLPHVAGLPTIDNFDTRYQICDIIFDSDKGVGATGNNDNIRYMGFAVMMKPQIFLNLCYDLYPQGGPRPGTLEHLKNTMLDPGWGPPMLYVNMDSGQVIGHEGRHRAFVFKEKCPDMEMLVHIKPSGTNRELRARDITKDMLNKMNKGLFCEEFLKMSEEMRKDERWKKHHFVKGSSWDIPGAPKLFSKVFLDEKQGKFK